MVVVYDFRHAANKAGAFLKIRCLPRGENADYNPQMTLKVEYTSRNPQSGVYLKKP